MKSHEEFNGDYPRNTKGLDTQAQPKLNQWKVKVTSKHATQDKRQGISFITEVKQVNHSTQVSTITFPPTYIRIVKNHKARV